MTIIHIFYWTLLCIYTKFQLKDVSFEHENNYLLHLFANHNT